jgi:hypothetical protein
VVRDVDDGVKRPTTASTFFHPLATNHLLTQNVAPTAPTTRDQPRRQRRSVAPAHLGSSTPPRALLLGSLPLRPLALVQDPAQEGRSGRGEGWCVQPRDECEQNSNFLRAVVLLCCCADAGLLCSRRISHPRSCSCYRFAPASSRLASSRLASPRYRSAHLGRTSTSPSAHRAATTQSTTRA